MDGSENITKNHKCPTCHKHTYIATASKAMTIFRNIFILYFLRIEENFDTIGFSFVKNSQARQTFI